MRTINSVLGGIVLVALCATFAMAQTSIQQCESEKWVDYRAALASHTQATPPPSLTTLCEPYWQKRKDEDKIDIRHTICPDYVAARYSNCADALLALKHRLNQQKHGFLSQNQDESALLRWAQIVAIIAVGLGGVFAAFSDIDIYFWKGKIKTGKALNVCAVAVVGIATAFMAMLTTTGVHESHVLAFSRLATLESRIEDSLMRGWDLLPPKKDDPNQEERREVIGDATIARWQNMRSQIFADHTASVVASNSKTQTAKLPASSSSQKE